MYCSTTRRKNKIQFSNGGWEIFKYSPVRSTIQLSVYTRECYIISWFYISRIYHGLDFLYIRMLYTYTIINYTWYWKRKTKTRRGMNRDNCKTVGIGTMYNFGYYFIWNSHAPHAGTSFESLLYDYNNIISFFFFV